MAKAVRSQDFPKSYVFVFLFSISFVSMPNKYDSFDREDLVSLTKGNVWTDATILCMCLDIKDTHVSNTMHVIFLYFNIILCHLQKKMFVLKLRFSFSSSFLGSFSSLPLYYDSHSNQISKQMPPKSQEGAKFLSRDMVRLDMLHEILVTCISSFSNPCS